MSVKFGREICNNLATAETREWLVTNGIGGYAAGTVSGLLTRRYHGLLLAALKPPLGRTLLLSKLNETVTYSDRLYPLKCDRWIDQTVSPKGYENIEQFSLIGTTPVWLYGCGDALIEKRIWMQQGENTTYIRYTLRRGSLPLTLSLQALVNYRDYHGDTHIHDHNWQMQIDAIKQGIQVKAAPDATSLYLLATRNNDAEITWQSDHTWYKNFALALEKYRGLSHCEDHLLAGICSATLKVGESLTITATTNSNFDLDSQSRWQQRFEYEQQLLVKAWQTLAPKSTETNQNPAWIKKLVLAANQFIVDRPTTDTPDGKTIIAGYPWFSDWGRDTMISLPGLTLATGRPDVARVIIRTFAKYVDRGMLPNVFPEGGEIPEYNTVDATLWYFEAIRAYYEYTQDKQLLSELFPVLAEIIKYHSQGTRYNIHLDSDGLLYAGETGVQLTWMDAKVGDWVVTPRIGKPVEINALWYNALVIMIHFALILEQPHEAYTQLATRTKKGFQRFWNSDLGYCYDVLDSPDGNDDSLRPNQIFAVSLPAIDQMSSLLTPAQQKSLVDIVARELVTSHGLRSLAPNHSYYQGHYGGSPLQRDGAYHQGTVWTWLIGHLVQAHLKVYQKPAIARSFLMPIGNHLQAGCVGNISEIFDGDAPFAYRGCFAQAWSVAEVLRSWLLVSD